jgi:hypothetical protein
MGRAGKLVIPGVVALAVLLGGGYAVLSARGSNERQGAKARLRARDRLIRQGVGGMYHGCPPPAPLPKGSTGTAPRRSLRAAGTSHSNATRGKSRGQRGKATL